MAVPDVGWPAWTGWSKSMADGSANVSFEGLRLLSRDTLVVKR